MEPSRWCRVDEIHPRGEAGLRRAPQEEMEVRLQEGLAGLAQALVLCLEQERRSVQRLNES